MHEIANNTLMLKRMGSLSIKLLLAIFSVWLVPMSCVNNKIKNEKSEAVKEDKLYSFVTATRDGTGKFYLGREISQVMSSAGGEWLERDNRQEEENANLAIERLHLEPDDVVADIGAGTGYYSFRIAQKVPKGKVYAVDIQDDFIEFLNRKKAGLGAQNVEVVKGSLRSPLLPENTIDLVVMADVYHELEFPHEMLQSIRRSLKSDGRLLLLEYRGEDSSISIKPLHKTTITQLDTEMEANGFKRSYDGEFLPIQHFLIYKKN